MGDFSKKTVSDNKHLGRQTSSKYVHIDGSTLLDSQGRALYTTKPRSLGRVVIATVGVAFTILNGSRVVAVFGVATPPGTYNLGVYCENGLTINGVSGAGSAVVTFDD